MSSHPDQAALEAYVLGHHDEIDPSSVEVHLDSCDQCMDEVGREARLEMLLAAAGREDVFASVLALRRRPRWPLVAAVTVAVAAAVAYAVWPSETTTAGTTVKTTPRQAFAGSPTWASGIEPGSARCSANGGDLVCEAASGYRLSREEAEAEASDVAIEALLEVALLRGGPAIRAQRALYQAVRSAALRKPDRDSTRRTRHQVASHAGLGRRDTWYWEEYERVEGGGSEFRVFVRFVASAKEIDELLAGYRVGRIDGAELVRIIPSVRWALDPGDKMAWFVHRSGKLATLGVRAGDVLLHDQRRNANAMRVLVERDEVRIWRQGLERPVPPSKLR